MIRQHTGATVVAAAVIAASLPNGLFEPGACAAAAIVVWALVIPGLIGRILPTISVGRPAAVAGICLAGLAVLATVSMAWADDQGRAFDEAVRVWLYLGLFALAACSASDRGRREWVAGFTVGLTAVTAIALFAYLQPGTLDSGVPEVSSATNRLSYPIGYWNGVASMVAAGAVLLAFWGARAPSRRLRSAAIAAIPLMVLAIWLTDSRGGFVALAAGSIALVVAGGLPRRQAVAIAIGAAGGLVLILAGRQMGSLTSAVVSGARRDDGDLMTALVLVVTAATAFLAHWADGWPPPVRIDRRARVAVGVTAAVALLVGVIAWNPVERFNEFKQPPAANATSGVTELSSHGRWQFWSAATDAFEEHPVAGVGAGGFEEYWAQHGTIARFVRNPHSLPLQAAAELGLPGLALLGGFFAAVGAAAWRRYYTGRERDTGVLLAVIVAQAVGAAVDWTWQLPAVIAPAVVCAALLTSSTAPRLLTGGGRRLGLAAIAVGCIALGASCVVALGSLELSLSRRAADAGNFDSALARARDARSIEPWSGSPYTQLALVEEKRGNIPQALAYLRAAEARDSEDWRLALIEGRLWLHQRNVTAARRAFVRARRLGPLLFKPWQGLP